MANRLIRRLVTDSLWLLVTCHLLFFPCRAMFRAQSEKSDDALRLLSTVGETYRELGSYRFSGNVTIRSALTRQDSIEEFVMSARSAPGRYRLQFGLGFSRILVTCDGSKTVVHIAETNQYVEKPTGNVTEVMDSSLPKAVSLALRRYARFVERFARFPEGLKNPTILKTDIMVQSGKTQSTCTIVDVEEPGTGTGQSKTRLWIDPSGIVLREEGGLDRKGDNPTRVLQLASWEVDKEPPESLFAMPLPPGSTPKPTLDPPPEFLSLLGRAEASLSSFSLPDLTGTPRSLGDLAGKVILLDFWATWCEPCLKQMGDLNRLYLQHQGDGLVVVGITSEPRSLVTRYYRDRTPPSYPILIDEKKRLTNQLQVSALPTLFVVEADGGISRRETGRIERKDLETILKESGIAAPKEVR